MYYTQLVPVGDNGELMGLLFIDSVLMVCSNYSQPLTLELTNPELIILQQSVCADAWAVNNTDWVQWGNSQYDFIEMTMKQWAANEKIVWKAAVQHYPIWFLSDQSTDYAGITNVFLPMLRNYGFDFHLNGHEHFVAYAHLDNSTPLQSVPYKKQLRQELCAYEIEYFFNQTGKRSYSFKQGEALHQITTGNTGKEDYAICYNRTDQAQWDYAENLWGAWT